ncbi:MAG: lipid A export permease/ATP-binding protein MsbA [Rubrivivax sp.]|nr:lipid A export permease/ATP-binding protein MsbA [Rubrivivax sp.]
MTTLLQRFWRLMPYVRPHRAGLLAALAAAVVTAITEPMIPALMNRLLDQGFARNELPLWMVPAAIIGLFAVRSLSGFVSQYGLAWTAQRAVLSLREAMFGRLLTAAPALFSVHSASGMTNVLVYEAQGGVGLLIGSLLTLVRDTLTLIALLAYLLYLNWQLTLVVALLFPAVGLVMRTLGKRLHRVTIEGQKATDELAYVVEENVLAWRTVRLHGAAPQQTARFMERAGRVRQMMMKAVVAGGTMTPVTQMLAACALSAVITMALWQSSSGGATVGSFVAFVMAMLQLIAPVKHLSDVVAPLTRGLAAVERGLDLIDLSPVQTGGAYAGGSYAAGTYAGGTDGSATQGSSRARGEIAFEDVSLRYQDGAAPAIDGLTLRVQAGETVALVGPSGAGKTTLANLLPRFIEPSSGRITLDGVPLLQWDVQALLRQLALVSQDVVLFNDSIAANVALGAPMSTEEVRAALRAAHLLDFVDGLPQGVETAIGHNGNQLSGGQRQRLAIARAIAKDAPVLILDEATSALDSESERAVQAALDTLMQGRTTIVIAHRLSTIENADRVLVLDAGRLVEQGTHAELLVQGGMYARLHAIQFKT